MCFGHTFWRENFLGRMHNCRVSAERSPRLWRLGFLHWPFRVRKWSGRIPRSRSADNPVSSCRIQIEQASTRLRNNVSVGNKVFEHPVKVGYAHLERNWSSLNAETGELNLNMLTKGDGFRVRHGLTWSVANLKGRAQWQRRNLADVKAQRQRVCLTESSERTDNKSNMVWLESITTHPIHHYRSMEFVKRLMPIITAHVAHCEAVVTIKSTNLMTSVQRGPPYIRSVWPFFLFLRQSIHGGLLAHFDTRGFECIQFIGCIRTFPEERRV